MNLAVKNSNDFDYFPIQLLSDLYCVIYIDNNYHSYNFEREKSRIIKSNILLKGFLESGNEEVNLNKLTIKETLIIDIGEGHINLNNVQAKNIIIKSAGFKSVNFKGKSSVENLIINNINPVKVSIEDYSNVNIKNVIIAPIFNTLEKATILLAGDFKYSNIIIKKSVLLIAGSNLKINNKVLIDTSNDSRIKFSGDFNNVEGFIVLKNCEISGDKGNPPINLNVGIDIKELEGKITFKGDLKNSNIAFNSASNVNCAAQLGNVFVRKEVSTLNMNIEMGTTISQVYNFSIIIFKGFDEAVKNIISKTINIDEGKTLVTAIQKIVSFNQGEGIMGIKISQAGRYKLNLKVQQGDDNSILTDEFYIVVVE